MIFRMLINDNDNDNDRYWPSKRSILLLFPKPDACRNKRGGFVWRVSEVRERRVSECPISKDARAFNTYFSRIRARHHVVKGLHYFTLP